jgi:hypothetical protein
MRIELGLQLVCGSADVVSARVSGERLQQDGAHPGMPHIVREHRWSSGTQCSRGRLHLMEQSACDAPLLECAQLEVPHADCLGIVTRQRGQSPVERIRRRAGFVPGTIPVQCLVDAPAACRSGSRSRALLTRSGSSA